MIESKKPFHVLLFEDLMQNPRKEIKKVLRFLHKANGFEVGRAKERLFCLSENLQGTDKRAPRTILFDPFTNELKLELNRDIDTAQQILKKANISVDLTIYKREIK